MKMFIASGKISSREQFSALVPLFKGRRFFMVIDNKDNPPLKIAAISTAQQACDMVAYLEKGKEYGLVFDNPQADPPDYDLALFNDSIPAVIPNATVGPLTTMQTPIVQVATQQKNRWLWPVIGIVLLLLTLLTWQLTKDMKKEREAS